MEVTCAETSSSVVLNRRLLLLVYPAVVLRDATSCEGAKILRCCKYNDEVVGLTIVDAIDLDENENAAAVLAAGRSVAKRSVDITITFVWRRLLLLSDANFMEE